MAAGNGDSPPSTIQASSLRVAPEQSVPAGNGIEVREKVELDILQKTFKNFWVLDLSVGVALAALVCLDTARLLARVVEARDRIVTERTLLALLAASAAQLGALAFAVGSSMFRRRWEGRRASPPWVAPAQGRGAAGVAP